MPDIEEIVAGLSQCERDLLTDNVSSWGSWIWPTSGDLIAKGLFEQVSSTERRPSALGLAVRARLMGGENV